MVRATTIAVSLTLLLRGCAPSCTASPGPAMFAPVVLRPGATAQWPEVVNSLRLAAGVLPVNQSADGARYALAAARCLTHTGQQGSPHVLDPTLDCGAGVNRTEAQRGAAGSLIAFAPSPLMPREMIEHMANAPFHAMAMFDPALMVVDYADAYDPLSPGGRNVFTSAIWVHGIRRAGQNAFVRTVMWPAPGWPVPGSMQSTDEWPSPLWQCGLSESGTPIWMAHPTTRVPPVLAGLRLTGPEGVEVQLCRYGADGMTAGDATALEVGADYMRRMGATMIVPMQPLAAGEWTLSGTIDGVAFERSFHTTG